MADWAAVARAVNDRMEELGVTQKKLSELSGVSTATLRKIQSGTDQQRNASTLSAICRALRLPEDHLQRVSEGEISGAGAARSGQSELGALRVEVAELRDRVEALEAQMRGATSSA